MTFDRKSIGKVMGIEIYHGTVHLSFEDYDNMFLKLRGKKPVRTDVYTANEERGRDYMLGFDFLWDDGSVERLSFKDFWRLFDRNWDWGSYEERIGGWYQKDGTWLERYSTLSWKFSEVVFQTHSHGACAFDRCHDKVTGFTADLDSMRESLKEFEKGCKEYKAIGAWMRVA